MSKMIFIKYLPPVRLKLVPKLKVPRICRNLAHLMFQIYIPISILMSKMVFMKYLPTGRPKLAKIKNA